jgi:hypothetical protein
MGMFDTIRVRIAAALSPQTMTKQLSRPGKKESNDWLMYQERLGYEDYDKMLRDPQIKSGFELIRSFLLSRKVIVTPASEDDTDVEIAQKIEYMFNHMDYSFRKVRNDMYTALIYGYSVGEIVWGADEEDGLIKIKRIRPIPIDTLDDCFEYDEDGNLETIIQQDPDGGDEIQIPAEKCLVYTYDEKFGDRRGTSILDAVYDNWFMKQKLMQWWSVYLQKHEGPTLAAFIENPAWKQETQDMLDDIREGRANVTAGMNDRIEVLESSHRGEGFKEAINYHDNMIFRKMNIGTLLLGEEGGSGAYAQSKTQFDVLSIFLDGIHEDIAAELQDKVHELVHMNWNIHDVPQIGFETFEEKDMIGLLNALKPMIDAMAIDPRDQWFKQLLSDIVSKYSDVDMSDFLEEEEQPTEQQVVQQPEVVPTPEEQVEEQPEEQVQAIEDVAQNIPAREE